MVDEVPGQSLLHRAYAGLQWRLQADLIANRSVMSHPGAKGSATEANWLEMFQAHLPHRYQAESAFVIDANSKLSDQIDIVLYDRQYTPEFYNFDGERIIPAESVYAVLEVKQELNLSNLEYAAKKIESVRQLKRSSAPIVHAGGKYPPAREFPRIIGGILTTEPGWSPPFSDAFKKCIDCLSDSSLVDLGCVATAGAFEVVPSGDPKTIETCSKDYALAVFFLRLLRRLQGLGTVPAIDYDNYLEAIARTPLI